MAVAKREATRMSAAPHIWQSAGRMVAAQRVSVHMVAVRSMAVAAGITAGQAATTIELLIAGYSEKSRAAMRFPDYANRFPDDSI